MAGDGDGIGVGIGGVNRRSMASGANATCAVLLASWFKVGVPEHGATLQRALVEPLGADVIALLTYRDEDIPPGSAPEDAVRQRVEAVLANLQSAIAKLVIERQLTTRELAELLQSQKSWYGLWDAYARIGCKINNRTAAAAAATTNASGSPFVCTGFKENGNSFMAPVFGNPRLNVLRQLYMHSRVHTLLEELEAARGAKYEYVVWSRLEYAWLRAHPPLSVLSESSTASSPPCSLWVPFGEDYAGVNDRHGWMRRDAADVYFSRFSAVMSGKVFDVLPCLHTGPCGQTSERYLAATLAHHNVTICRFPPTAYLRCCEAQGSFAALSTTCYKLGCHTARYHPPDGSAAITARGKYPQEVTTAALHSMLGAVAGARLALKPHPLPPAGFWVGRVTKGESLVYEVPESGFRQLAASAGLHTHYKVLGGAQWTLAEPVHRSAEMSIPSGWEIPAAMPAELLGGLRGRGSGGGLDPNRTTSPVLSSSSSSTSSSVQLLSVASSGVMNLSSSGYPTSQPPLLAGQSMVAYESEADAAESAGWGHHCPELKNESDKVAAWDALWPARAALTGPSDPAATQWDESIFSYHEAFDGCTNASLRKVPIEPLVSFLRHPRHICYNKMSYKFRREYIVPLLWWEAVPFPPRRTFFFDMGASLYDQGTGGASQSWFLKIYHDRGIDFDRILAWEAHNMTAQRILGSFPPGVMDRLSYYNMPVEAKPGSRFNPWRTLKSLATPSDLVIVKLDIDTPTVEAALVEQLLADAELAPLIDEFYYEHHVSESPMIHQGWGRSGTPTQSLVDSYAIFTGLRERGIRAHSWV